MKTRSVFIHYLRSSTVLLLLGIGVTLGVSYLFAERILIETVKNGLQYHADFRKDRIVSQFLEQKRWMEKAAGQESFVELIEQMLNAYSVNGASGVRYKNVQNRFHREYQALLKSEGVEDLFLVNIEGELIFSLRALPTEIGELVTADGFYGRTVLSDMFEKVVTERSFAVSNYGRVEHVEDATVLMGIPLYSVYGGTPDEMIGVLIRPFSLDRIRSMLKSYSGLGETGEVILAQSRGERGEGINFISHFRNDRQPDSACLEMRRTSYERFSIYAPLQKQDDAGWRLDNRCQMTYSVGSWIPELRWGMAVKQDQDEVLAPISTLQFQLSAGLLPLILLLLWLAHKQSIRLSQPLIRLVLSNMKWP